MLQIDGVSKRFGDTIALDDVTLRISDGEYLCVLGPSGSGKTTLLRLVAGFLRPDAGAIVLDGKDLDGVPAEKRPIHTVFQDYALFPHMTVLENVAFGPRMGGRTRVDAETAAREALAEVAMAEFAHRAPRDLSGGEKQRVALARVLVNEPRVVLLDEPLGAVDRPLRIELQGLLEEIRDRSGSAFVHVTHDQEEALRLGTRVAVLTESGSCAQVGRPAELYRGPASPFVASFMGSANLLDARVEVDGAFRVAGSDVRLLGRDSDAGAGSSVTLMIRPESFVLAGQESEGTPNSIPVRLERRRFLGPTVEYVARVGDLRLTVTTLSTSADGFSASDRAVLEVASEDVVVLP